MAEQNPNGGGGKSDGQLLRCPHCAGPLTKEMETSHWTLSPLLRDSFSMIGSGFGGFAAIFYSYLHTRPVIKRWIKGPMWVQILVGAPPNMIFASVCAGLAGEMAPQGTAMSISSTHSGSLLVVHFQLWLNLHLHLIMRLCPHHRLRLLHLHPCRTWKQHLVELFLSTAACWWEDSMGFPGEEDCSYKSCVLPTTNQWAWHHL